MWRFASSFVVVVVAAVAVAGALLAPAPAGAVVEEVQEVTRSDVPFGGVILAVIICENAPIYVLVYDYVTKSPIPLGLLPTSRLNMWFAPYPGNAALGTYFTIPGECVLSYYPYSSIEYLGTITNYPFAGMGTSLEPPVAGA